MKGHQGWASARTLGRIGTELFGAGLVVFAVSLARVPYDTNTELQILYAILFGSLAIFGWALTWSDRKARGLGFWNYKPDTSGTWLVGSLLTSLGIIAGAYTILNLLEGKSAVDGSWVGLIIIEVLA